MKSRVLQILTTSSLRLPFDMGGDTARRNLQAESHGDSFEYSKQCNGRHLQGPQSSRDSQGQPSRESYRGRNRRQEKQDRRTREVWKVPESYRLTQGQNHRAREISGDCLLGKLEEYTQGGRSGLQGIDKGESNLLFFYAFIFRVSGEFLLQKYIRNPQKKIRKNSTTQMLKKCDKNAIAKSSQMLQKRGFFDTFPLCRFIASQSQEQDNRRSFCFFSGEFLRQKSIVK